MLFEMIRHERHIEADKWELAVRLAASVIGDLKYEDASELAKLVRHELGASLNHITPTLDYTIAKAEAHLAAQRKKHTLSQEAKLVAAWDKPPKEETSPDATAGSTKSD